MTVLSIAAYILVAYMLIRSIVWIIVSLLKNNVPFWYKGFVGFLCGITSVIVAVRGSAFLIYILALLDRLCQVYMNRIKEE